MHNLKKLPIIVSFMIVVFSIYGCAATKTATFAELKANNTRIRHINVPFVKQKKNWCGPAALASILNYWGEPITQDEIAADLYLPTIKGVLNFELEHYAAKKGFWAQGGGGTWQDLKAKVTSGIPVLVLVERGVRLGRVKHYLVITGFSEDESFIIAHDGVTQDSVINKEDFILKWKQMNNWMLSVTPYELVDWTLSKDDYLKLGLLAEKQYKLDFALYNYNKALKLDPKHYLVYFNIGNVYFKMDDLYTAKLFYIKAAELNANFADAYNNLACVYLEAKEYDLAKSNVAKALAIETNPEREVYYLDTLGLIYLNQGRVSQAIVTLKQAEQFITPGLAKNAAAQIYHHLAQAYLRAGMGKEADATLEKAKGLEAVD